MLQERIHATRRWIFRWKGLDGTSFRGFLALIISGGLFALFGATVRIQVSAPQQWVEKKASLIQLPADETGKIWALRAQEGGPYPARFNVDAWERQPDLTGALISATRLSPGTYEPRIQNLPVEGGVESIALSDGNERVFPSRKSGETEVAAPVRTIPVPVLYPRSGISVSELPAELPAFDPALAGEALQTTVPRDFLLELDRSGRVLSSTDLSGNSDSPAIRNWLMSIDFGADVAKKSPVLAIAIGFTNSPLTDGPAPR